MVLPILNFKERQAVTDNSCTHDKEHVKEHIRELTRLQVLSENTEKDIADINKQFTRQEVVLNDIKESLSRDRVNHVTMLNEIKMMGEQISKVQEQHREDMQAVFRRIDNTESDIKILKTRVQVEETTKATYTRIMRIVKGIIMLMLQALSVPTIAVLVQSLLA